MKSKLGVWIGAIVCTTFLMAGVGFSQDDAKVSLKDWTKILDSKVAEQVGDKGMVNYEDQYIEVVGIGAPPDRYYGKPQARPMCLRAAEIVAKRDILEIVEGVRIDSETMVKDYAVESDSIRATMSGLIRNARKVGEPNYLSDGTCEVRVRMSMRGPFMAAIIPKAIADDKKTDTHPPKIKVRQGGEIFTGLVVDARGLGARPAMSPKIFDENGKEVYGSLVVSKEYAVQQGISGYARDLTAAQGNPRVTANPITVKGLSAEGPGKSDIKISNDANRIRMAKENLTFMQKCRVMIVLD